MKLHNNKFRAATITGGTEGIPFIGAQLRNNEWSGVTFEGKVEFTNADLREDCFDGATVCAGLDIKGALFPLSFKVPTKRMPPLKQPSLLRAIVCGKDFHRGPKR